MYEVKFYEITEPYKERKLARDIAFQLLFSFYRWGGDDPSGWDCSGLVIEILKSVSILSEHEDYTSDVLYRKFEGYSVKSPYLGCLAFWGTERRKTHVAFCIDEKFMIEAGGGGRTTLDREDAIRQNAYVRLRPIASRRGQAWFCDPFLVLKNND
jgi:cell wall-associated NlpC family hydrolase